MGNHQESLGVVVRGNHHIGLKRDEFGKGTVSGLDAEALGVVALGVQMDGLECHARRIQHRVDAPFDVVVGLITPVIRADPEHFLPSNALATASAASKTSRGNKRKTAIGTRHRNKDRTVGHRHGMDPPQVLFG